MLDRVKLTNNMADNLPTLRTRLGLTQEALADKIGTSRSTIISIETRKRDMTWSTFLSLVLLFSRNEPTAKLLEVLEIDTQELNGFLGRQG